MSLNLLLRDPGIRQALDHVGKLPVGHAGHLALLVELGRAHLLVDVLLSRFTDQDFSRRGDLDALGGGLLRLELAAALLGLDDEESRGGEGGGGGALRGKSDLFFFEREEEVC